MNERDIISSIRNTVISGQQAGLVQGIGDDCAVIDKDGRLVWLVTMDTLVEGIHFDRTWHPAEKLGRKSVAVNISDIAAMGGRPVFAFLSLGLPQGFDPDWFSSFSQGITDACSKYNCFLAGGDTVRSNEGVIITITVIGEMGNDQVVYRSGAVAGDTIWVTGSLGMAAAGLQLCQRGINPIPEVLQPCVAAHLDPQPRVKLGSLLAEKKLVHAMMDLSDGLATDLSHLCRESGVGAVIEAEKLPTAPSLEEFPSLLGLDDSIDLAISGGEDYELLFTASADSAAEIISTADQTGVSVAPVGHIVEQPGIRLRRLSKDGSIMETDVSYSGFDHFSKG